MLMVSIMATAGVNVKIAVQNDGVGRDGDETR